MRNLVTALALVVTGATLAAQSTTGINACLYYNTEKTQYATRATTTSTDTIYFMQPQPFLRTASRAVGWRIVLQDQNQATSEFIRLAYHAYQIDNVRPIVSPIGRADFTLFGIGTGIGSYDFTLTLANPVAVPEFVGYSVVLPAPHPWAADVVLLHYQRGDNTKVKPQLRIQSSFVLAEDAPVAEWTIGSTFHWGGLFTSPVVQHVNWSRAYGTPAAEPLLGPESLFLDPARVPVGDRIGWQFTGDRYRSLPTQYPSFSVLFLSSDYGTPILTPFGPLLIKMPIIFIAAFQLDSTGKASFGSFQVPNSPLKVSSQCGFVNYQTTDIEFSNACIFQI